MDLHRQNLGLEAMWDKWEKSCSSDPVERDEDLHIVNPSVVKQSLTREAVYGILAMTIARNNEVQLIMQSSEDTKYAIVFQKISDFLSYVAQEPVTKLKNYLDTILLGTGVRKRLYRCDTRTVKEITKYDPETEEIEYKETTVKDYDDADLQNIDIRYFYWDERATSHKDMRDCAERKVIPFSSFLDEYPVSKFKNADKVRPGSWQWGTEDEKRDRPIFAQLGEQDVEVFEYYNKLKDMRHIIANGVLLTLETSPIPYKHKQLPYTISVFNVRENTKRLDGKGIPELVEHDQALLDTITNMIVDWMKLLLNKPLLETEGDELDGETENIKLEAGKRFKVNDINNFKFFEIPPIDRSVFEAKDMLEKNAKKKVGFDDPMSGVKTGGTATENAIAAQASKEKIDLFFKLLEEDVDVRDEWLKLNIIQQFYSEPVRVNQIIGEDGKPMMNPQGEPMTEPEYRKLPIGIEKGESEFGEEEYKEKKDNYFEIKPESLGVKDNKYAQFTVRVASRSTLPISKELKKKQWREDMDSIAANPFFSQMANWEYLWKKTNEIMEIDPDEATAQQTDDSMTALAEEENGRMMKGENIPPTQGATEDHTAVHMALADSTDFDQLPPEAQKVIIKHADGEVAEQRVAVGEQNLNDARTATQDKNMQDEQFNNEMALKGAGKAI